MELTAVWPVVPMTQLGATKPPIGPVPEGGVVWHTSHAAVVTICVAGLPSTMVETVVPTLAPVWQVAHPVVMPVWFIAGLGIAKPPIGPTPVGAVEWHVSHAAVVGV